MCKSVFVIGLIFFVVGCLAPPKPKFPRRGGFSFFLNFILNFVFWAGLGVFGPLLLNVVFFFLFGNWRRESCVNLFFGPPPAAHALVHTKNI